MLVGRDGASTQRELIQQTGSDKAGMARTVELLTVRGYLDQRPSATDRRVVELRLTPAGREAFVRGRALVDAEMATLFAELEDDEIATLEALLTRFVLGE
jgi:DNA-binding MarR family transcriptional regulator